jgi:hypothetical protein
MLDNRAKPRLSSRGCGAANALLTGCARYGLWKEPGRRNGALTRTKKLIFKRKKDARSPADFADENWASPKERGLPQPFTGTCSNSFLRKRVQLTTRAQLVTVYHAIA